MNHRTSMHTWVGRAVVAITVLGLVLAGWIVSRAGTGELERSAQGSSSPRAAASSVYSALAISAEARSSDIDAVLQSRIGRSRAIGQRSAARS